MNKFLKGSLFLSISALAALSSASCDTGSGKFDVWTSYSTSKIIQQSNRNNELVNNGETLQIKMMRDEYESTQLIITSKKKQYFDLVKTDLVDETTGYTIPKENIEIYVQKYLEIDSNHHNAKSTIFYGGDRIPDLLLPLKYAKSHDENFVSPNSNQGISIEVDSNGLKAGNYKGTFTLKVGNQVKEVPIEVTIWDIALNQKSALQTCWLIYSMYMYTGEYDASEAMIDTYQEFLTKYKANPYVIQEQAMNSPEALFQDVERMWDMKNYNSIIIPYDFPLDYDPNSYQGDLAASYIVKLAEKSTEENFYLDYALFYPSTYDEADVIATKKAASPSFFEEGGRYDQTLEKAITILQNKGYFAGKTDAWNERVKTAIRNIPDVFTNVGYVENWVREYPATFAPQIHVLDSQKNQEVYQDYAKLNSNGDLWTYTCVSPVYPYPSNHLDDDCLSMRVLGWMEKYNNINGYLFFMANMYTTENQNHEYTTPYTYPSRNGMNGDGYIMYPGRPYGSPTPFPSMRLVTYRDGLEDYEMLEVYENLIKDACEKYGITDIDPRSYAMDVYNSIFTNSVPTEDHHALYRAREEIANRILSFEKENNYFTNVKEENGQMKLHVYSQEPSLSFRGITQYGEDIGNGNYHNVYTLSSEKEDLVIQGQRGSFVYHNPGYTNLTNFSSNSDVTVSVSDESSYKIEDGKLVCDVKSVLKESANKTIRFTPSITINNVNLENAKKLIFKYSNPSTTQDLLFDVQIETSSFDEIIGGHFCIKGGKKSMEIDLTKSTLPLRNVKSITIKFVNYYFDENEQLNVYDLRNITIEDIYAQY